MMDGSLPEELTYTFQSLNYISPLLGAYLADVWFGRYMTIVSLSILYIVGMFMCAIASHDSINNQVVFFLGLFGGVAMGSGGIKPNVVVLGADQFDVQNHPDRQDAQNRYFNYF